MRQPSRILCPGGVGRTALTRSGHVGGKEEDRMWEQVHQALSLSTTRVLSQVASLLPGIVALVVALLVAFALALIAAGILRRSLIGIEFDERVVRWGFTSLAEWSPHKSPTLLVARVVGAAIVFIG